MPAAAVAPGSQLERRAPRALRAGGSGAAAPACMFNPTQERARRQVVRLVFLLLLMAIAEGAVRKWVAPQFGAYIFFLRDPVLLLTYAMATHHRLWPRKSALFMLSVGMAALGVLLLAMQIGTGGYSDHRLILGVYGWRAYFLYAPLAFLVGATFGRSDLLRLFKLLLWLAVPIAVLVAVQFFSPIGAPINVGIAEEQELQFKGLAVTAERTRTMGPFASIAGQQQFVAVTCAVLLAFFVSPRGLPQPPLWTLIVTGAGVLTCIALSGSRGTVLQCALAVAVALLVGFVGRGGALKGRAFVWPLALSLMAVLAFPIVFPEGHESFTQRWAAADSAERLSFESAGVFGRAFYGLIDFTRLIDMAPALGYGLGFGGNAAITLNAKIDGLAIGRLAETDFARHMVDLGPPLGLGYILFRLAFAAWLSSLTLQATRRHPDPMPMLLWSYVVYVIVMGQLTGQGSINFFGWLFAGLLIASCRQPAGTPRPWPSPQPPARRPIAHNRRGTA